MKASVYLFLLTLLLTSCFRPPDFPDTPKIRLERIELTDEAQLLLTFNVKDGDGDIGLQNEADYNLNQFPEDLLAPYHQNSWIVDANDEVVTISSEGHVGPYTAVPAIAWYEPISLLKYESSAGRQVQTVDYLSTYFRAGDEAPYSEIDERPDFYDCEVYEIVPVYGIQSDTFTVEGQQGTFIDQSIELIGRDTIFVQRNPFFFNLYLEIEIKDGDNYVPIEQFFDVIEPCDPIYTSRFPVFDRSDFGRPVDGNIQYAMTSGQFLDGPILEETIRIRFFIYDRAFNQSNEVITPDFKILDLRQENLEPL